MKYNLFILVVVLFGFNPRTNSLFAQHASTGFSENKGQWNQQVLFKASLDGGSLFIENDGLTFSFYDKKKYRALHQGRFLKEEYTDFDINFHAYKVHFENSNPQPRVEKLKEGTAYENFFLGADQNKWKSNVKNYSQVFLREIYRGIDYEITSNSNQLKYNFHVKANANPSLIQISYEGVSDIKLVNGALVLKLSVNEVTEKKPYAYQIIDGRELEVACNYKFSNSRLSFDFPNGYDKNKELIIDPVLVFAAQSGSTADNFGMTATYDSYGNLYSGGTAFSSGYPTTLGAFSSSYTGSNLYTTDVVITKYNASGTNLLFSTYIGGSHTEVVSSMIVDGNDNLCFYGATSSADFPMLGNSYDSSFNGGIAIEFLSNGTKFVNGTDIYIAKFNASGSSLLGCTYLGGSDNDGLNHVNHKTALSSSIFEYNPDSLQFNYGDQFRGEIQIDLFNNIYITSSTRSLDFPTVNAFDNSLGGKQDAIVSKFNSGLTQLIYSTYLGGSKNECGNSLVVNAQSEVFVTGGTCSTDFPTSVGANNTSYSGGKADGYITHLNALGNQLLHSTLVGTTNYDQSYFIQMSTNNDVFIFGQSLGNMPIVNYGALTPYNNPGTHQFITRYTGDLSTKKMSTVFGSSTSSIDITPSAFGVDMCKNIYISGWGGNIVSGSPMSGLPLSQATQSTTDGFDFYLMTLDSSATTLLYGSYFGGASSHEHVDGGTSRIDKTGTFYQSVCAGCGGYDDFPVTTGAWPNTPGNPNHSANCNNGTFKISAQIALTKSSFNSNTNTGCAPLTVSFTNNSSNYSNYTWYLQPGLTNSVTANPVVTFTAIGSYTVSLAVKNPLTCNKSDSSVIYVNVTSGGGPTVSVSSSNTILCAGESSTLTAGGASFYFWNTGNSTPTLAITPTVTTTYSVVGTGTNGCETTATITQLADNCTSIERQSLASSNFTVYPNPVNNELNISSTEVITSLRLFSSVNELVIERKKLNMDNVLLNVQAIKPGLYILELNFENTGISSRKILKLE